MTQVRTNSEARVANAFERSLHVHTFPVLAHAAGRTLVHIHAESVVLRGGKARLTDTMIRSRCVFATAV